MFEAGITRSRMTQNIRQAIRKSEKNMKWFVKENLCSIRKGPFPMRWPEALLNRSDKERVI